MRVKGKLCSKKPLMYYLFEKLQDLIRLKNNKENNNNQQYSR